jgi:hypothetical protein
MALLVQLETICSWTGTVFGRERERTWTCCMVTKGGTWFLCLYELITHERIIMHIILGVICMIWAEPYIPVFFHSPPWNNHLIRHHVPR